MNLPIPSTPPAATSTTAAPPNDPAVQPSDPFSNILARQLTGVFASPTDVTVSNPSDIAPAADSNKNVNVVVAAPDGNGAQQAGILAALMQIPMLHTATNAATTEQATAASAANSAALQPIELTGTLARARQSGSRDTGKPSPDSIAPSPASGPTINLAANVSSNNLQAVPVIDGNAHALALPTKIEAAIPDTAQPQLSQPQYTQSNQLPLNAVVDTARKLSVDSPVGSNRWSDDFSQSITWLATQRDQSAELHLNPPHLGPLDVVIKISGDQATALFASPHAAVRDAVEQAMPKLREMLADSGIMLGNATVSDQGRQGQAQTFTQAQAPASGDTSDTLGVNMGIRVLPANAHQGVVDTFV